MQDLADVLGMHKSTISLALAGKGTLSAETRQRVLTVAGELGYEPNVLAQRLARGHANTTVCIFSGVLDAGLATEKLLLIQNKLNAHLLEVPIYTCYDPTGVNGKMQAAQIKQICRQRPRAILCAVQRVHRAVFEELAIFQRHGGIVMTYDTPIPLECDQVIFDREDNAYRAARYLLENGHRQIGLGMSQAFGTRSGLESLTDPQAHRLRGFQRALTEYGSTAREDWFFRNATYERGGEEMARQFLQLKERPTALAIVNDYVALAFMVEVIRAGVRIPQDLSVIGHDNQPIAAYCPVPLTTMTQPVERIARTVSDLLMTRTTGGTPDPTPQKVIITGELVERASVAACSR